MDFLTPARRKAIYGVVSAGLFALLAFGVITTDQVSEWTRTVAGVIATLTTLLAFINTNPTPDTTEQVFVSEEPSGEATEVSDEVGY